MDACCGQAIFWQDGSIGADLENGLYALTPVPATGFVAGFVKGGSDNHFAVRVGDGQQDGSVRTVYDGARPKGYEVMKKQGGIILGIGGDNSPWGAGIFYEGAMTIGYSTNTTEEAIMANIVAAGYGK